MEQNIYKTVWTETNIFFFLNLASKSICNNVLMMNLKLTDIQKNRKEMLIWRSINTYLHLIFLLCRGLENVHFIDISLCLVELSGKTLLLVLSNIIYPISICYVTCFSHAWDVTDSSLIKTYFITFSFNHMQFSSSISDTLLFLYHRNILLLHYSFYYNAIVSGV